MDMQDALWVEEEIPALHTYDIILVNSSGGKDSQAMLDYVTYLAKAAGVNDRIVVVHSDLGRVEWDDTAELAERQARAYGHRFIKVKRPQGDLLEEIEKRGMFPDAARRYCTAHHKRGQVRKVMTQLVTERREGGIDYRPVRLLNCMGLRADESPARKKKAQFERDDDATNGRREVDTWLPIHKWTEDRVWRTIKESGIEYHEAYDLGMPRLSCCFCVLASKSALVRAAQLKPDLAREYARVERDIGHRFRNDLSMAQIIEEAEQTEEVEIASWTA